MTRAVHLQHNLLPLSSRKLSKKHNTLIQKQIWLPPCHSTIQKKPASHAFLYVVFLFSFGPPPILPILLHHFFCFCHIVLWLPCVILLIPTFPFHFVFPTYSLTAWSVVWDWLDNITCACAACPYWRRRWPPCDSRIQCTINLKPTDINGVVDHHVVWEV